jgi:hypothetical protein
MDRRIVFILVALAVIIPMLFPVNLPVSVSEPTQKLYDYIDELPAESTIMLAFDYGPSSLAELSPMAKVLLKQCFDKDIRVVAITLIADGTTLASTLIQEIAEEKGAVEGEDYVFLGFRPGRTQVILGMGTEIASVFENDYNGKAITEIPMMENITNYDDIAVLIDLASSSTTEEWIIFANVQYNLQIAAGVTGVIISQMYPYLQTGQLVGLISGIMGAAEYERLIDAPAKGMLWINIESFVHLLIVILVVVGNIIFFQQRQREE